MSSPAASRVLACVALLASGSAAAQTAAPAPVKPAETTAAVPAEKPKEDITHEAVGTLAGLYSSGNVNAASGKVGGHYQLRFWNQGLRLEAAGGLAALAVDTDGDPANGFDTDLTDNVNTNAQARIRYDFFLSDADSLYASGYGSHDSAGNLLLRLRAEAGYRRYIFTLPKHALSAELGAVYQIDNAPFDGDSNGDGLINLTDGTRFENTGGNIGARLLVGYTNAMIDNSSFSSTMELVPNIFPDVEAPFKSRLGQTGDTIGIFEATTLTWNNTFTVNIADNLSVGASVSFLYDAGAIVRRNAYSNSDIATSVLLTYKVL